MNSDESHTPEEELTNKASDDSQEPLAELVIAAAESESQPFETKPLEQELVANQSVSDSAIPSTTQPGEKDEGQLAKRVAELERQKQTLEGEIRALQESKNQMISEQMAEVQGTLGQMVKEGLKELEQRRAALQISVEQLERRRERIREEMRTSFAGVSQELAMRVQGFKDYLLGSLQDLAATAEQLELPTFDEWERPRQEEPEPAEEAPQPQFAQQEFQEQVRQIQKILDQYRTIPDYYGPPWQLRRTFEPIHAERVQDWFFVQGGRGAIRSMGSRLQNILVASAIISVLHSLYGDRCRTLVLANTPERLGEWRRGLQDCLGISRSDFGPERGIVLFEATEALVQKADRLIEEKQLPLAIVDETEDRISLSLLQFPLWLVFAPDPQQVSSYLY